MEPKHPPALPGPPLTPVPNKRGERGEERGERGEGRGLCFNDKPHNSCYFHLAAEERQMVTLSALPRARLLFMQTFEDLAMCKSQAGAARNHICAKAL